VNQTVRPFDLIQVHSIVVQSRYMVEKYRELDGSCPLSAEIRRALGERTFSVLGWRVTLTPETALGEKMGKHTRATRAQDGSAQVGGRLGADRVAEVDRAVDDDTYMYYIRSKPSSELTQEEKDLIFYSDLRRLERETDRRRQLRRDTESVILPKGSPIGRSIPGYWG